jgi:hypothetical protein
VIKPFWKSKTVLFNVLAAVVMAFLNLPEVGASPELVAIVVAIVNLALRFITKEPISTKGNKVIVLLLVPLLLIGCAMSQVKQVRTTRYSYNQMLSQWIISRDDFDVATRHKVDDYFMQANAALKAYESAVVEKTDGSMDLEEFLRIKKLITDEIGEAMGWTQKQDSHYLISPSTQLSAASMLHQ